MQFEPLRRSALRTPGLCRRHRCRQAKRDSSGDDQQRDSLHGVRSSTRLNVAVPICRRAHLRRPTGTVCSARAIRVIRCRSARTVGILAPRLAERTDAARSWGGLSQERTATPASPTWNGANSPAGSGKRERVSSPDDRDARASAGLTRSAEGATKIAEVINVACLANRCRCR